MKLANHKDGQIFIFSFAIPLELLFVCLRSIVFTILCWAYWQNSLTPKGYADESSMMLATLTAWELPFLIIAYIALEVRLQVHKIWILPLGLLSAAIFYHSTLWILNSL